MSPSPPERVSPPGHPAAVRIGAVAYLNTRPLVLGMEQGLGEQLLELSYDVPAVLAERMRRDEIDVALMPVIALAELSGLEIVPGLGIVTAGAARSVLLISRGELAEVRTVALDPESRTSNALTRVLLAEHWNLAPAFTMGTLDLAATLAHADAAVRIGDKALFETPPPGTQVHDLGSAWTDLTGLPFVFAAWIARPGAVDRKLYRVLHESRRRGTRAIDRIAEDYTWEGRRDPALAARYLTDNIRYRLGSAEVQGLKRFLALAARHHVIERAPELHFTFERVTDCHRAARCPMPDSSDTRTRLDAIGQQVLAGERITAGDAQLLLEHERLTTLGALADIVRRRKHPGNVVTYIIDRNINYTNVCNAFCSFCAFYRAPKHEEGYVLPVDAIEAKIRETYELGGNQILLQGGHNPKLKIDYYEDLFRRLKQAFPDLWLHALSPPEIVHIYKSSRLSLAETLERLRAAGLDSIPGGGAEILVNRVREELAKNKCSAEEWLDVMEKAHCQGIRSTATMMFGHVETLAERVEHLERVRDLQDRTSGFTAFICWTYQADHTELGGNEVTSAEYLRTLAVARLFLDNVDNLQASWVTQGPKMGAASLAFGVNDMGSTMIEENVVSAAGTAHAMNEPEIVSAIREAGRTPRRRDMTYSHLSPPRYGGQADLLALTGEGSAGP